MINVIERKGLLTKDDKDRLLRNPPKEEQKKYIVAFRGVEGRRTGQFNLTLRKFGKD